MCVLGLAVVAVDGDVDDDRDGYGALNWTMLREDEAVQRSDVLVEEAVGVAFDLRSPRSPPGEQRWFPRAHVPPWVSLAVEGAGDEEVDLLCAHAEARNL